ncbi:MAG: helix-turn-helix domain-containing protein, partial [Pseudomonadota bacterium]
VAVDVRVMAATHHDLATRVEEGEFRDDLFHRLNVIRVAVPPLRERRDDIPALLAHYLGLAAREMGVPQKRLSADAEARLIAHDWPGNVRELVNACQRLTALAPGNIIHAADIPPEFGGSAGAATVSDGWPAQLARWAEARLERGGTPLLADALPEFERTLIRTTLARVGGRRQEAARLLGWGRNTLTRKIREHEL